MKEGDRKIIYESSELLLKKLDIDKSTIRRLYIEEGKNMPKVAKIFDCSVSLISQKVKEFGLKKRT